MSKFRLTHEVRSKEETKDTEKIKQLRQLFEEIDYKPENVDEWMMKEAKTLLASIYSKGVRITK